MEKTTLKPTNKYCPQALFLYGTYKEDGTPNFGLFCWVSYCWDTELGVMACIGGEKLTKDRIRQTKVFSANLVTEPLLPLADYLGNTEGYTAGKMDIPIEVERGAVLPVPILKDSPINLELEVAQSVQLDDSEIFICKIRNVLAAVEGTVGSIKPVVSVSGSYYAVNPETLGPWGTWRDLFSKG